MTPVPRAVGFRLVDCAVLEPDAVVFRVEVEVAGVAAAHADADNCEGTGDVGEHWRSRVSAENIEAGTKQREIRIACDHTGCSLHRHAQRKSNHIQRCAFFGEEATSDGKLNGAGLARCRHGHGAAHLEYRVVLYSSLPLGGDNLGASEDVQGVVLGLVWRIAADKFQIALT